MIDSKSNHSCNVTAIKSKRKIEKIAIIGVFSAFAAILSYIEVIISFGMFIPGVKLGLANIAIVVVLYIYGYKYALFVNVIRIIVVGLLFTNAFSIAFSLAGALISFVVMLLLKKLDVFSPLGVSVAGGVSHNIGQLLIASFIVSSYSVMNYIPVLMIAGIICGFIIGITSIGVIRYTKNFLERRI